MNKEKQIEEMGKAVDEALIHNVTWNSKNGVIGFSAEGIAKELIDDGYRLAAEVAEEIDMECCIGGEFQYWRFLELKKKYTEGGE